MQTVEVSKVQSNNFELKQQFADLSPSIRSSKSMSMQTLEARRVSGASIPASRNGLEVICGASCETGAQ